jgi:hypothetical protein
MPTVPIAVPCLTLAALLVALLGVGKSTGAVVEPVPAAGPVAAPVSAPVATPVAAKAIRVTLDKRVRSGPYDKSAYSFRYASRHVKDHFNEVDLVLDTCGNLHLDHGGAPNRIVKVTEKLLSKIKTLPEEGWITTCFTPQKSDVYVMEVSDGRRGFYVSIRIVEVKSARIGFEWQPLVVKPTTLRGTHGACAGPHECP